MSDAHRTLVDQATAGDPVAIEDLIVRHHPRLVEFLQRKAGRLVLAKESLSDLVQSVCREVLVAADGFEYRGKGAFVTWLHRLALAKIVDKYRYHKAEKRDPGREVRLDETGNTRTRGAATMGEVCATFCSPSQIAMAHENSSRLAHALDQLNEEHQEVIFLAYVMDLPRAEIAQQMGRSHEATRALLGRAKARLGLILRSGRDG